MVWIVSIISGALIAVMVYFLLRSVESNHLTVNQRMQSIVDGTLAGIQQNTDDEDHKQRPVDRFMKMVRELSKSIRDFHGSKVLDFKMQQAGLPLLGSEFIVIDLMAVALGCIIAFLLTMSLSMAFIGGIAGFAVPWVYLSMKINRRQKLFTDQLQDTLSMVANALRVGFSFMQAMDLISREMPDPMGEEFKRVVQDIRVGSTQEAALERMSKRVNSDDFNLVVTAVLIQHQVGGNLSTILDTISTTINDRIKMKREAKTLTAQGRMSGWVLAALPIGITAVLFMINPTYFDPLLRSPMAPLIIGGTIGWMCIGILVINRIVDIKAFIYIILVGVSQGGNHNERDYRVCKGTLFQHDERKRTGHCRVRTYSCIRRCRSSSYHE